MTAILHNIRVHAPLATVQAAIAHVDGFSSWWAPTTGSVAAGEEVVFAFGAHQVHALVSEVTDVRTAWTFTAGAPEWVGTTVSFDLSTDLSTALSTGGERRLISFSHAGWAEAGAFYAHCSMKWAIFLLSLKALTEQGVGQPFPNDTAI